MEPPIRPAVTCQNGRCTTRPSITSYWWLNCSCGAPVQQRSGVAARLSGGPRTFQGLRSEPFRGPGTLQGLSRAV